MDQNVKVSIITVCYNSEQTIRRTIESVLHQTYQNIEYIIVDGSSQDSTIDIVKQFEPLFEGRLKWISEKDNGIYDAMNKGIAKADGEIIGIINSDDFYEKDAVEIVVAELLDRPFQILYGMTRIMKDGKEVSVSIQSHEFLKESMISHPACFVTSDIYKNFGVYDTQYKSVADYDFMLRMAQNIQIKFVPIYKILSNFCLGGMCSTSYAYEELLRLRKNWGLISKRAYSWTILKIRIYNMVMRK